MSIDLDRYRNYLEHMAPEARPILDERDPQYLRHDTKKAVEELATRGVHTFCLTLDPQADRYVERIFGPNGYTIVDRVERLPEKLPMLFVELTG